MISMKSSRVKALFVAAGVSALAFVGCSRTQSAQTQPTPVRTAEVQVLSAGSETRYSANIVPDAQVDLAFKSGGYVATIKQVRGANGKVRNIDVGDRVSQGTVLAVVRQSDYVNQREQAKAQFDRAQADYEHAKLNFDRMSNLYGTQSATKPDYDSAKAEYDGSQAALSNARAALSEAQIALDDCSIRAPFDGWITKRSIELGALVGPSTSGFTLANTNSVRAVFGVPDSAIQRIKLGQAQSVATDSLPNVFSGRITAISPAADPKSRVYSVEVTIPNPRNELKAGMIASIALGGEAVPSTPAVPLSAVVRDPENPEKFAVLLVHQSGDSVTVRSKPVELGDAYGNMVQVLSGLTKGDRVVTAGATLVKNGEQVRVVE